jgi:hypothetical protein
MGRGLFTLGAVLLLLTIALWIAGVAGWVPQDRNDQWSALSLKAGLLLLAASFVLRLLVPLTRQVRRARCAVCGRPVDKGHTYCMDHLRETVNACRDRTHDLSHARRRP